MADFKVYVNPFFNFRRDVQAWNRGEQMKQITRHAAVLWRGMTPGQKLMYQQQSLTARMPMRNAPPHPAISDSSSNSSSSASSTTADGNSA